jgi:hypothetical protein
MELAVLISDGNGSPVKLPSSNYQMSVWDRTKPAMVNGDVNTDAYINRFFDTLQEYQGFVSKLMGQIRDAGGTLVETPEPYRHPLFASIKIINPDGSHRFDLTLYR